MRRILAPNHRIRFGFAVVTVVIVAAMRVPTIAQEAMEDKKAPQTKEEYRLRQNQMVNRIRRINKSLLADDVAKEFRAIETDYKRLVGRGTNGRNQAELDTLQMGLEFRILTLADVEVQGGAESAVMFNNIKNDLRKAGNTAGGAAEKIAFRKLYYDLAWPYLLQLMEHNIDSRTAAIRLMEHLEVDDGRNNGRLRVYEKVPTYYASVLKSPDQPNGVKSFVLSRIINLIARTNPSERIQMEFAVNASELLRDPLVDLPFATQLLFMMEEITAPRAVVGPKIPVVICATAEVMSDRSRDMQMRCLAARVSARAGYDSSLDYEPIAWRTAQLAIELATELNDSKDKESDYWGTCAWYIYLAFRHEDRIELRSNAGFLNRDSKSELINAASEQVTPIVLTILQKQSVQNNRITSLFAWTKENRPRSLKFDSGCPPIQAF